jgi:hypothetical protein
LQAAAPFVRMLALFAKHNAQTDAEEGAIALLRQQPPPSGAFKRAIKRSRLTDQRPAMFVCMRRHRGLSTAVRRGIALFLQRQ